MEQIAMGTLVLSSKEARKLEELEGIVERGLKTFVEVGNALLEIRDSRLYREEFDTFEGYCKERWGMSRIHAHRMIQAAGVADNLLPMGNTPSNERQARPLTSLEPEQQREAWQKAREASGGKPTSADVEQAVEEIKKPNKMDVHYSSDRQDWETPQELFNLLDEEFGFTLDVCASPNTAKCDRYFTPEDDGLSQQWSGKCWMNPPYGNEITDWVEKAYGEGLKKDVIVVCLLPARTDTSWWWDYCRHGQVRFLKGRLKFGGGKHGAPFPSAVVVFDGWRKGVIWWEEGSNV